MNFKHLQEESHAIDFLADHLTDGSLVLFLGAGTSRGFGLPGWTDFANGLRHKAGLSPIEATLTPEQTQNAVDEALDIIGGDIEMRLKLTKEILYPKSGELEVSIALSNKLLIAISSLLIGSRRGHITRVVTFNYDSMLEWFLSLFGFQVNTISTLPALEGSEDVRIYHPHGFAPHPTLELNDSSFLILGLKDANKMVGARSNLWLEKERQIMESGVCLFVGMSGHTLSDRAIAPLLSDIGDQLKDLRPLGVWIFKDKLEPDKRAEFLRNNIVPLEIHDEQKIAEFLLKISQKALENQKK